MNSPVNTIQRGDRIEVGPPHSELLECLGSGDLTVFVFTDEFGQRRPATTGPRLSTDFTCRVLAIAVFERAADLWDVLLQIDERSVAIRYNDETCEGRVEDVDFIGQHARSVGDYASASSGRVEG